MKTERHCLPIPDRRMGSDERGKGHPAPATGGRGPSMNDNPYRSLSRVVIFRTADGALDSGSLKLQ
jgi:hypothetical protein